MPYQYSGTGGAPVTVTTKVNMCETQGMMSVCRAITVADQHGCKHHEDHSNKNVIHCSHWRESINRACDNMYAQGNLDPRKK